MNPTTKTIAIGIVFAALASSLSPLGAQQQSRINPRVEVQRDYEGRLIEVEKPKLPADIPDSISQFNITMDYAIFDKPYYDLYSFAPLPWVHLSSPGTIKQPWVHLRLGALYPTSPLADLMIQAPTSGKSALLLTARHRSFWGELPRYEMAGATVADQMQNRTDVRYALNWSKGRFEIGGGYDYNYYTYYGIAPELPESFNPINLSSRSFMRDSLAHAYNLYKADLSLSSLRGENSVAEWRFTADWKRLDGKAHLWNLAGEPSIRENLIRFSGEVGVDFMQGQRLGAALYGSLANDPGGYRASGAALSFNPFYRLSKERFTLHAGVIISFKPSDREDIQSTDNFFFYPQFEASYRLIPDCLNLYADVRGENRHNSYQSLLAENPWLSQNVYLENSDLRWVIQAGFKGKVAHHLGYNLYGQYVKTNNQYYYQNIYYLANLHRDNPYPLFFNNTFSLLYMDEERLSAVAELSWNSTPLTLYLTGKYHSYSNEHAWYKPSTEINFSARYQWRERIIVTASAAYKGEVTASPPFNQQYLAALVSSYRPFSFESLQSKIKPYTNIGLQLEYRFAEWFGLYVEGQNLLNAKIQNYLYYYEPGIRIGGGVTFRL